MSVVNTATIQPGMSPGAMVSIMGQYLGTQPRSTQFDAGLYPTDVSQIDYNNRGGGIRDGVFFNGIPAPLLYVSPNRIDAVVPYDIAGQQTVDVVVTHNLQSSPAFSVPLQDTVGFGEAKKR